MKTILALVVALALAGCNDAMETQTSANGAEAKLIAEVDGCRLWRVYDGSYVYLARCPEGASGTQHDVSCGKNCTEPQFTVPGRLPVQRAGEAR